MNTILNSCFKPPHVFAFALLVMTACNPAQQSISEAEYKPADTLKIDNKVYCLDSISEAEYNTAAIAVTPDKVKDWDAEENIDDKIHVTRDSLKLIFHLLNGADSVLVNDTVDYMHYKYLGFYNDINAWLVHISYYEGGGYLLMNRQDGKKQWLFSTPVYSPDKKHFVCYSCDLMAEFDPTGIEIFAVEDRTAKPLWSKNIANWGPDAIRWKNDSTLYIKKRSVDYPDNQVVEKTGYRAMKIKL